MDKKRYSNLLIWSAALIAVVRYMGAFIASDVGSITGTVSVVLSVLMGITGIGMGLLDSIGSAFLFNGWRLAMPRTGQKWSVRFRILTIFVFSLVIDGLIILIPFTVSRVLGEGMGTVLTAQGTWWWSAAVNIAPYMLIGGVMSGNSNMVTDNDASVRSANEPANEQVRQSNGERKERTIGTNVRSAIGSYLSTIWMNEQRVAGATEISEQVGCSKGFASDVTKEWKSWMLNDQHINVEA